MITECSCLVVMRLQGDMPESITIPDPYCKAHRYYEPSSQPPKWF